LEQIKIGTRQHLRTPGKIRVEVKEKQMSPQE
jgi:hypothetical protein